MSSSSPDEPILHVYMLKFKYEYGLYVRSHAVERAWSSRHRLAEVCKASPTRTIIEADSDGFLSVELSDVAHKPLSEFTPLEQDFMREIDYFNEQFEMTTAKCSENVTATDSYLFYVGKDDPDPARASHLSEDGVYGTWAPAFRHMMSAHRAAAELPADKIDRMKRTVWFIDTNFPLFSSSMSWVLGTVAGRSPSHGVTLEGYSSLPEHNRTTIACCVFDTKELADAFRRRRNCLPWFFVPEFSIETATSADCALMRVDAAPKSDFRVEFMSGSGLFGDGEEDYDTTLVRSPFGRKKARSYVAIPE